MPGHPPLERLHGASLGRDSGGSTARLLEMRELVEWSRVTVKCARAQLLRNYSARQMEIHAAGAYGRGSH